MRASLYITLLTGTLTLVGCGKNLFAPYEKSKPQDDAALAMEQGKPDKAIAILEEKLQNDPENYRVIGLLAAAYAQRSGIETISIALQMATSNSSSSDESSSSGGSSSMNTIVALFSVLPDPSSSNIDGIVHAIELMGSIPVAERTLADNFYLTLLNTSLLGLRAKAFDTDHDNQLSPVELLEMSDEAATAILTDLLNAEIAMAGGTGEGGNTQASTEALSKVRSAIEGQEGTTDAEKLRNYLGRSSTSSSTTTQQGQ